MSASQLEPAIPRTDLGNADIPDFGNLLRMAGGMMPGGSDSFLSDPQFMSTVEEMTRGILQNFMGGGGGGGDMRTLMTGLRTNDSGAGCGGNDVDDEKRDLTPRTKDLVFSLPVTLEDLYRGKTKKVSVKRKRTYEQSDGSYKMVEEKSTLSVRIEPGMKNDHQFVFEGEADQIPGYTAGNVVIMVKEQTHPTFLHCNDDLFLNMNISISELYYLDATIDLPCGKHIRVQNKGGDILTDFSAMRKLPGYGMPILGGGEQLFGDLFIQFTVVPTSTPVPEKETLTTLFPPLSDGGGETEPLLLEVLDDRDYYKLDVFEDDEDLGDEDDDDEDDDDEDDDEDDDDEDEDDEDEDEQNDSGEDLGDQDTGDDEEGDDLRDLNDEDTIPMYGA